MVTSVSHLASGSGIFTGDLPYFVALCPVNADFYLAVRVDIFFVAVRPGFIPAGKSFAGFFSGC